MSFLTTCLRNAELSAMKARWSRANPKNSANWAGLRRGNQCRKFTALAYVACLAAVVGTISWQTSGSSSLHMERLGDSFRMRQGVASALQGEEYSSQKQGNFEGRTPFIQDVVAHTDELLLLLRLSEMSQLPVREWLLCGFGNSTYAEVNGVEQYKARAVVRCSYPLAGSVWSVQDISLEGDKAFVFCRPRVAYRDPLKWSWLVYEFWSDEEDVVLFVKGIMRKKREFPDLSRLKCVYNGELEVPVTAAAQEVFRCPHPPIEARQQHMNRRVTLKLDGMLLPSVVYYEPTFRVGQNRVLDGGLPIREDTVRNASHSTDASSILIRSDAGGPKDVVDRGAKKFAAPSDTFAIPGVSFEMKESLLCSCNLIWNGAKFLREWVMYHSVLGVEKFFLYDNNSDDDIKDVVQKLVHQGYNIKLIVWPWLKTQEAGFSHCALSATSECTWMLYADVDEFVFPALWINQSLLEAEPEFPAKVDKVDFLLGAGEDRLATEPSDILGEAETSIGVDVQDYAPNVNLDIWGSRQPLGVRRFQKRSAQVLRFEAPLVSLILDMRDTVKGEKKVGQISISCRDFGPSGLTQHPNEGVTLGYTCRLTAEQRHKSIVLLAAIDKSLKNYIHHFSLGPDYHTVKVHTRSAVVNHYKYQAWDEFKTKFKRRVSTYVADWTEMKKLDSKDRAPGLGNTAVKPPGWEKQFCEVKDFGLRKYSLRVFSTKDKATMMWQ